MREKATQDGYKCIILRNDLVAIVLLIGMFGGTCGYNT
jgi:hypothetical protein